MNEKELIRRALMGDKQAQEECTEKGIVLPCPFCGEEAQLISEKGLYTIVCKDGPCIGSDIHPEYGEAMFALEEWNTRPAPPIGRCGECKHCVGVGKNQALRCTLNSFGVEFGLDFITSKSFCSYFEPREESR